MMQTIQNLNKKEKGFTLIELMIVVAIIGILAAIAIPQFGAFKKKAQNAKAISDLGSITTAEEVKFNEDDTYVLIAANKATSNSGLTLAGAGVTKNTLYEVLAGTAGIATEYAAYASNTSGSRTYGADQSGAREYMDDAITTGHTFWSALGVNKPASASMSIWAGTAM